MQERIFKDNYELFEMMLKEINQWRKNFQSNSVDDELLAPIFYMYDVMEKNVLFIRDEYRNSIEPAVNKFYALGDKNGGKLTEEEREEGRNAFIRIGNEQDCMEAMLMMNSELMEALFKLLFPEDERDSEIMKGDYIGPDVDFEKMPRLPSVLKVSDFDFLSTVKRLDWLVDHYHDDENAKLYLKARQDVRKKYKEKLKVKKGNGKYKKHVDLFMGFVV